MTPVASPSSASPFRRYATAGTPRRTPYPGQTALHLILRSQLALHATFLRSPGPAVRHVQTGSPSASGRRALRADSVRTSARAERRCTALPQPMPLPQPQTHRRLHTISLGFSLSLLLNRHCRMTSEHTVAPALLARNAR